MSRESRKAMRQLKLNVPSVSKRALRKKMGKLINVPV